MKKILLAIMAIPLGISCSKKTEAVRICYECSQVTVRERNGIEYSFDTLTNTRCNVDQNAIDSETIEKNYVREKDGITSTSTFACKIKDQE